MAQLSEAALKRLEEARARSEALADELSNPATFEDARRAAELGREQGELADVVARYEQYLTLVERLSEAEELLRDGAEDDLKALAEEEVTTLEPRIESVVAS